MKQFLLSLLVLSASVARADEPAQTIFFFGQGNPAGLSLQYSLAIPWKGPFAVGIKYANYVFSNEAELSLRYRYLGGLIDLTGGVGTEGGFYYELLPGQEVPAYQDLDTRTLGIKRFARGEALLNLKMENLWIHGRFSPAYRRRDYVEIDFRRATVLQNELSVGTATAIMHRAWGKPKLSVAGNWNPEGWAYVEYTRETVQKYASDDNLVIDEKVVAISRPSVGIIGFSPFGWKRVSYDIDLYYSLVDRNLFPEEPSQTLKGFGAQLFVWVSY
jgi:hypothetical protein